ncbi:SH3 domain-containing protein [Streptomyces sp. DSM 44915]|uniref:SH3 domain-containing protein n=1 Tax=Streptomyces chisholmiae TaxID=3075540 RepID=A0ABU2JNR6_9ACTN|nr:SH3 domain-containing protein [Streptomyces sp. DSM 44915]MDT0266542.1 SH3 domain-containing protein [Streptomyces sp. DSM 44915]
MTSKRVRNRLALLATTATVLVGGSLATAPAATADSQAQANSVYVWENGVNIRERPTTDSRIVGTVNKGTHAANCQRKGDPVTIGDWQNDWWIWLANKGGYITAVYAQGGSNNQPHPGIPIC